MRTRFGLAALSNKHFEHTLFPLRTPHAEYLPRYAHVFDVLELAHLYHDPVPDDRILRWVAQAPPGFLFTSKLDKHAVAPESWDDAALSAAVDAARHRDELLGTGGGRLVVQFPARFQADDTNIGWLGSLLAARPHGSCAVEFRHASWWRPDVRALLEDHGAALVWSTHHRAPSPDWVTADDGYVRFIGKHHDTRGRHVTVEDRLDAVLDMRSRLLDEPWAQCVVIVTNTFEGNAIDSLPRIAAALGNEELARRTTRKPGATLLP